MKQVVGPSIAQIAHIFCPRWASIRLEGRASHCVHAAAKEDAAPGQLYHEGGRMERNNFSNLFYVMLVIGIIGVLGLLLVAIGSANGSF